MRSQGGRRRVDSDGVTESQPARAGFGSWMGSMWLYTLLRFGMFFALWGILELIGVYGFLSAVIALVLSVPLSLVLLAKPRAMFARNLEARLASRNAHRSELDTRLQNDELD
jgi:O-antigen ligase